MTKIRADWTRDEIVEMCDLTYTVILNFVLKKAFR